MLSRAQFLRTAAAALLGAPLAKRLLPAPEPPLSVRTWRAVEFDFTPQELAIANRIDASLFAPHAFAFVWPSADLREIERIETWPKTKTGSSFRPATG